MFPYFSQTELSPSPWYAEQLILAWLYAMVEERTGLGCLTPVLPFPSPANATVPLEHRLHPVGRHGPEVLFWVREPLLSYLGKPLALEQVYLDLHLQFC